MPDIEENKRRYERFKANLQVRYHEIGSAEKNALIKKGGFAESGAFMAKAAETQDLRTMISEDLSVGGVRVNTPFALNAGAELWVNLKLPGVPISINALATVMWTKAEDGTTKFYSGLKFSAINQSDIDKVESFLALQKKPEA